LTSSTVLECKTITINGKVYQQSLTTPTGGDGTKALEISTVVGEKVYLMSGIAPMGSNQNSALQNIKSIMETLVIK